MADQNVLHVPAGTVITAAIMPPSPPVTSPQAQPHVPLPLHDHNHDHGHNHNHNHNATRVLRSRSHNQFQGSKASQSFGQKQSVVLHLDSSPLPDPSTLASSTATATATTTTTATAIPRTDSGLAISSHLKCNPPTTRTHAQLCSEDLGHGQDQLASTSDSHASTCSSSSLAALSDAENASSSRPAKRLRTAPLTPQHEPVSLDSASSTATETTYAPPSPLKSDDLPLSSPALYANLHNSPSTPPPQASQPPVSPRSSYLERLPTNILTRNIAGRYVQQLASLLALAASSRNLFSKIAPLVWRDPWDYEMAPVTRLGGGRFQDDPILLQAVRNGMSLGVEVEGNLGENSATGYYAQHVAFIPSQSASQAWTKQTRAKSTLHLTLDSAQQKKAERFCIDLTSAAGIIADLTAEKHRLRLVDSFWSLILLPCASSLTTLHVEIATPLFPLMSCAIAQAGGQPIWPHLRDLSLAFHVGTQPEHMRQLAGVLKAQAEELRTLSLTMLNAANVQALEPLRDIGESLCNLRRVHIVPVDDAISPVPALAQWLADFLGGFPTATFRHLEIFPTTEYSRTSYYSRSLASLPVGHFPGVHRLTLWLPHVPNAIAKHVVPLARAWGLDTLTHLDCAPYTQHPRSNWGGQPPAIAFAGRERSVLARFARTAGGMLVPDDLGAQLHAAVPALDTLHLYCLAIDESLAQLASLRKHATLAHVHLGLAPPCLQANPLDPPPRRVAPELAKKMAHKVSTFGAYAYLARIARALVVAQKPNGGKPIRSMSWMCLPMKAGEARVFDVDQAAYVASTDRETGRRSVVGEMGLVMRYEEDAQATWAVCGLGVHACASIRKGERERRLTEDEERRGPLTRRQAAKVKNG